MNKKQDNRVIVAIQYIGFYLSIVKMNTRTGQIVEETVRW